MSTYVQSLYLAWEGTPFTRYECQLACALRLYVHFEDDTPLDDQTIGRVIASSSGLEKVNCAGLVDHLRRTNDLYITVSTERKMWTLWARNAWVMWLDPKAPSVGKWP